MGTESAALNPAETKSPEMRFPTTPRTSPRPKNVALTATTRIDDLIDAVVAGARVLRRIPGLGRHIDPDVVALTIALMLRTIPALFTTAGEVQDAARARGLERSPRALVVPIALRTVARAQSTGEALHARGILERLD